MGFLTSLVNILLPFTVGSFLISLGADIINLEKLSELASQGLLNDINYRIIISLVGILLILLPIRFLQSAISSRRKEKSITFESVNGTVKVTLAAIEDMIKKVLEERRDLTSVKPKVILDKKDLDVVIKGNLSSEVNILDLTEQVQHQIKEKLQVILGHDREIDVNIEICKINFNNKKNVATLSDEEPEVPFRNF